MNRFFYKWLKETNYFIKLGDVIVVTDVFSKTHYYTVIPKSDSYMIYELSIDGAAWVEAGLYKSLFDINKSIYKNTLLDNYISDYDIIKIVSENNIKTELSAFLNN